MQRPTKASNVPPKRIKIGKRVRGEARGGRGKPCRLCIHRKSPHMQRWLMRNPWIRPFIVFSFAASQIQRIARGFLVRRWGSLQGFVQHRQGKLIRAAKIRAKRLSQPFPDYRAMPSGLSRSQVFDDSSLSQSQSQSQSSTTKTKGLHVTHDNKQLDKYLAFTELVAILIGAKSQGEHAGKGGGGGGGGVVPNSPVTNRKLYSSGGNIHSIKSVSLTKVGRVTAPKWLSGGYSVWCTVRVQAWYRMCIARRHYFQKKRIITQIAALVIQNAWKSQLEYRVLVIKAAKRARIMQTSPKVASTRIQLAWRAYCNRRIYAYYRDLVVNKLQGAPAEVLKTIIPNESGYLDKAAGAVVKFRLGSSVFPPKIYFKIFTYRGVCDVNAFAPRDYVHEKPLDAVHQNVKDHFIPKDRLKYNRNIRVGATYFDTKLLTATSTDNWYKREEKNPWRPLASQLFEDILTPPWLKDQVKEKAPAPFHFSLLKRKTDIVKQRKQRKREWLRKAYMLAGVDLTSGNYGNANVTGDISGNSSITNKSVHVQPSNKEAAGSSTGVGVGVGVAVGGGGANVINGLEEMRRKRSADMQNSARNPPKNTQYTRTYSADHQMGSQRPGGGGGGGGGMGGRASNNNNNDNYNDSYDQDPSDGNFSESLAYLSLSQTLDQPTFESKMSMYNDSDEKGYARRGGNGDAKGPSTVHMPTSGGIARARDHAHQGAGPSFHNNSYGNGNGNTNVITTVSAKNNMTSTKGFKNHNESEDNEDLLQWSMALDFDDYANNWSTLATNRG